VRGTSTAYNMDRLEDRSLLHKINIWCLLTAQKGPREEAWGGRDTEWDERQGHRDKSLCVCLSDYNAAAIPPTAITIPVKFPT
jgi:hypothetical protein